MIEFTAKTPHSDGANLTIFVESGIKNEHAEFKVWPSSYEAIIKEQLNFTPSLDGRLITDNRASALDVANLLKEWGYSIGNINGELVEHTGDDID